MNIGTMTEILNYCDAAGKVPLIEGKHGIGKSQITMQYAKDNNMHCEQIILSLMDTADLLGMPQVEKVGGTNATIWAAPSWYNRIVNAAWPVTMKVEDLTFNDNKFKEYHNKQMDCIVDGHKVRTRESLNELYCNFYDIPNDALHLLTQNAVTYNKAKRSVLFLDEFNRAPTDILNASLQLILDKRLNDHILPVVDGQPTFVVAAINPDGQDYTVNSFDPALMDRFVHFEVESDTKEWLSYAKSKGISSIIRDFLTEHPNKLHFEPANGGVGATPRSWVSLDSFINFADTIKKEHLFSIVKGNIGSEIGAQFLQFFNNYQKVVKFADVEKAIKEFYNETNDIEAAAELLKEKITDKQETVQQMELAAQFYTKYMSKTYYDKDVSKALPLLIYVYSMPLEQAAAFIISTKDKDESLIKFAKLDLLNNKKLLLNLYNISKPKD